jgi:RNA polymerase sigma factor (sigma-70 family)
VGDEHAQDVTQAVFIVLARKAPRLCRKRASSLAGWLFRTTRYAASDIARRERRRREREQSAAEEEHMAMELRDESTAWEHMKPALDAALDSLGRKDREAILLRYFQGASYADVGKALRVSENAAAKRVSRATERLRRFFDRQGIAVSMPVLGAVLTARTSEAVSAALVTSCASAALGTAAGAGAAAAVLIAKGTIKAMLAAQLKAAAVTACAVAAAGVGTVAAVKGVTRQAVPFRLVRIEPVTLVYKARSTLPDGSLRFQINHGINKTAFVRMGETIRGFTLVEHTEKHEGKTVAGLPNLKREDVSELLLKRDDKAMVLVKGRPRPVDVYVACLVTGGGGVCQAGVGETFETGATAYRVQSLDVRRQRLVVRRLADGREISIRRD